MGGNIKVSGNLKVSEIDGIPKFIMLGYPDEIRYNPAAKIEGEK